MEKSVTDEFTRRIREEIKRQVRTPSAGSMTTGVTAGDGLTFPLPPPPAASTSSAAVSRSGIVDKTSGGVGVGVGAGAYDELQSLIGSLNVNVKSPGTGRSPNNSPPRPGGEARGARRGEERTKSGEIVDDMYGSDGALALNKTRDLLRSMRAEDGPELGTVLGSDNDLSATLGGRSKSRRAYDINTKERHFDEVTKIKFGTALSVRNSHERYMTVLSSTSDPVKQGFPPVSSTASSVLSFSLGVEGQGIGEDVDCFTLINSDNREDSGPVRYGSTVSVKAAAAKDRYLSVRDGKIGFWRSLIGKAEKWILLKALSSKGSEDLRSQGSPVCTGDLILLQDSSSSMLLSIHDAVLGRQAKLTNPEKLGLGEEVWRIELFGSQPLPEFMSRPYLNGHFVTIPASLRYSSLDAENRTFPGRSKPSPPSPSQGGDGGGIPALTSYSPAVQHAILARELLLALSGVEGLYIRVAANQLDADSSSSSTGLGPGTEVVLTPRNISLVLNVEDADRSVASQISLLLPICECGIRIREFIKVYSRYEYGKVSHALTAGIKTVLREFDLLIAQLEMLEVAFFVYLCQVELQ